MTFCFIIVVSVSRGRTAKCHLRGRKQQTLSFSRFAAWMSPSVPAWVRCWSEPLPADRQPCHRVLPRWGQSSGVSSHKDTGLVGSGLDLDLTSFSEAPHLPRHPLWGRESGDTSQLITRVICEVALKSFHDKEELLN